MGMWPMKFICAQYVIAELFRGPDHVVQESYRCFTGFAEFFKCQMHGVPQKFL